MGTMWCLFYAKGAFLMTTANKDKITALSAVSVRFGGDSGDGMQLTGSHFTDEVSLAGNDFATAPDFPAEIRAPRGTTFGVSGSQVQFSSDENSYAR